MPLPRPGRPSPSMIVALIALFVALGGSGYAALTLPKNSVGSAQLKNKAVTPKKVAPATVKLFKGRKGAMGNTGAAGAPGPQGVAGPKGDKGDPGPASGPAGGDLTGNYPDPAIAAGAVSNAEIGKLPQARLEFTLSQLIADNTVTTLSYDTAVYDNASLAAPCPVCQTLTAPVTGVYAITASVKWDASSTGTRFVSICKNSLLCGEVGDLAESWQPAAVRTGQSVSTQAKLAAGDFVAVNVSQISGAPLSVLSGPHTNLAMSWIGNG